MSQCSRGRVCYSVTDLQMRAPKKGLEPQVSHRQTSACWSPLCCQGNRNWKLNSVSLVLRSPLHFFWTKFFSINNCSWTSVGVEALVLLEKKGWSIILDLPRVQSDSGFPNLSHRTHHPAPKNPHCLVSTYTQGWPFCTENKHFT